MQHVYILYLGSRAGSFQIKVFKELKEASDIFWELPDNHISKHGYDRENSWVEKFPVF